MTMICNLMVNDSHNSNDLETTMHWKITSYVYISWMVIYEAREFGIKAEINEYNSK